MGNKVKRKTDRFVQFTRITSNTNYRDTKGIIKQFNESVRSYKRFVDVFNAGDEELAASKLHKAATELYMCCEWSLKNYLYKRYDAQLAAGEISQKERTDRIDDLSKGTTKLFVLLNELYRIADPAPISVGIDKRILLRNASINVNN